MTESLHVDLNRETLHEIEPEGPVFETPGSFDVVFRNHSRAVHVHIRVDEALASVATVDDENHFVETEGETRVRVKIPPGMAPMEGSLEIVTGYGSESERVRIHIREPEPAVDPTPVSEGLGETVGRQSSSQLLPEGMAGVAMLLAPTILLAAVALVIAPSPTVAAGAIVLLSGLVVAGYLLLS